MKNVNNIIKNKIYSDIRDFGRTHIDNTVSITALIKIMRFLESTIWNNIIFIFIIDIKKNIATKLKTL